MAPEPQLRQTLGDAGWSVVELTSITVPLDSEKIDAVLWMLRATR
jgi:hypothetical protein